MATVVELARELEKKRAELHAIFEKAKTDQVDPVSGQPVFDMDSTTIQDVNDRNKELNVLNDSYEKARLAEIQTRNVEESRRLQSIERSLTPPEMRGAKAAQNRRLSDMVLESTEFKGRSVSRNRFSVEFPNVDVKTLMETSNGFAAPNDRTNKIVLSAQRRPVVSDLIPTDATANSVIKWMAETVFSNSSAATVAEAGLKPEGAIKFTETQATVEKIAVWLPVTEEQLDDIPGLRNVIDNRLMLMLQLEEEDQLLNGNGSTPNLRGLLNATGIQSQAKGADSTPDAIYKAFTLVRHTGFAEPSGVVMHPNDWQTVRLLTTTDGLYIFGGPADEVDARIWGKPVIVTTAETENTALVGDFVMYSHISRKSGIRIDVSDSHDTYFIYNKLAIRAEMRESLEIYRGSAFCKVTGV